MSYPEAGRLVAVVILMMSFLSSSTAISNEARTESVILGTKYTIHSELLGGDRTFIVNLPEGYESTNLEYPVLYILDAEYFYYQSYGALQFLSECGYNRNRPVPQMILVAVLDGDRNRDFTPTHAPVQGPLRYPTSGEAARYLTHVEKELLPFVDNNFRTSGSILAGWSFGGLFTFYTFLVNPDLFSAYIAISPSLWWNNQEPLDWAEDRIQNSVRFDQKLVITQGALEGGDIGNSVKNGIVPLLHKKEAAGWEYVEIPGVSHNYVPYKALYEGLRAVFSDFAVPQDDLTDGLEAIKRHYRKLSASYGYEVNVPNSVYMALVEAQFNSRDPETILPITSEWMTIYPHSAVAWYFHGRLFRMLNNTEKARLYLEKALELEQVRMLPDSEWLNPMKKRLKELGE